MNISLLISMLRKGRTGNEIIKILDEIADKSSTDTIEF